MTVKIYVSKDSNGREWAPDYVHEMEAVVDMLRKLWTAYHHHSQFYAVIVNLQWPVSADFVLITQRGLGILDLKHYPGLVIINHDGTWYAGDQIVKSGSYATPTSQVFAYADSIRKIILPSLVPHSIKIKLEQRDIKVQTGIVFTHPRAVLSTVREQSLNINLNLPSGVDNFSVLAPWEIVKWAASLRFSLKYRRDKDFEPYWLSPSKIDAIVREQFKATEWTQILPSMPSEKPYAYLKDVWGGTVYKLDKDTVRVGRSSDCDIIIPAEYGRVSRHHCIIVRKLDHVELHQEKNKHGTYMDGKKVVEPVVLSHKQMIYLGGESADEGNCALRFVVPEQAPPDMHATPSTVLSPDRTVE